MKSDIRKEVSDLGETVEAFQKVLNSSRVIVARISETKVILVCDKCEATFHPDKKGLKCWNCGQLIPVIWPGGAVPSASSMRSMLRLTLTGDPLFSEDSSDVSAA